MNKTSTKQWYQYQTYHGVTKKHTWHRPSVDTILDNFTGALQEESFIGWHLVEDDLLNGWFPTPADRANHSKKSKSKKHSWPDGENLEIRKGQTVKVEPAAVAPYHNGNRGWEQLGLRWQISLGYYYHTWLSFRLSTTTSSSSSAAALFLLNKVTILLFCYSQCGKPSGDTNIDVIK